MPTTPNGTVYTETQFTAAGGAAWRTVADNKANDPTLPVMLFCHGNPGATVTAADKQFAAGYTDLRNWLIDNGWGFIEGHGAGANWGNAASRTAYEAMVTSTMAVWNINRIIVIGRSMGALVGSWLASQSSVVAPKCAGFISLSGTANLSDRYSTASGSDITNMNAAYGVTNDAQWRAAVAAYDPMLVPVSTWDGKNAQIQWDTSDTTVPYATNGQAWDSKYGPRLALRRTTSTTGGDHNTTPNNATHISATIQFFQDAQLPLGQKIKEMWVETGFGLVRMRGYGRGTGTGTGGGNETQEQLPALKAGAPALGSVNYAVPTSNTIFLSPTGSDGNSGTQASPKGTIAGAISACPTGGTVVVMGGVYEQKAGNTSKRLTIQPYQNDVVWFDGTQTVTGFTGSGPWVKTGWTYQFDHSTSYTSGDTGTRLIDPAYPMAAWPDMVFIDDVRQTLVSGTPGAGQFAVDYTNNTLTLGTNPAGKTVRATTLDYFGIFSSPDVLIQGINIRRYATGLGGALATLTLTSAGLRTKVMNVRMEDCGQQSISVRAHNQVLERVTIIAPGCVGAHSTLAEDVVYDRIWVDQGNYRNFKHQPIAAAVKFSPRSHRAVVKDSVFTNSRSYGIWFDTDCFDIVITGNLVRGSLEAGILSEANDAGILAGNYLENCKFGISSALSTREEIWCNQCDNNSSWDIGLTQDERRNTNSATMARAPWLAVNVRMNNNVMTLKTTASGKLFQMYALDKASNVPAPQMVSEMAGNLLVAHNGDGTTTRMFGWDTNGDNQVGTSEIHKSVTAFESITGWVNAVTNTKDPTPAQVASFASRAKPLPAGVASKLNVPANTKLLGPPRAKPQIDAP